MRVSLLAVGLGVSVFSGCAGASGGGAFTSDGGAPSGAAGAPGGTAGATHSGGAPSSLLEDAAARGGEAGSVATDGGVRESDGSAAAPEGGGPALDGAAAGSYVCSLILGIATTSEWFGGFEKVVDNARWELKFQDSAHIEKWADPANAVWSLPITSPCAEHADTPDRLVFMGTNYDYATVDLFLPKYVAVWNNIKIKYPSVRHLDVMTYARAPGNAECVGADRSAYSYIKPAQDEAIARFAAMYPGIVVAAPRWEVQSCDDFTLCPHLTGPANARISMTIGAYFLVD